MVIKILELGILTELTEEEEESYKGGIGETVPAVPEIEDAETLPASSVINVVPPPIVVPTPIGVETT